MRICRLFAVCLLCFAASAAAQTKVHAFTAPSDIVTDSSKARAADLKVLVKRLGNFDELQLVSTPAEADLIVEVLDRGVADPARLTELDKHMGIQGAVVARLKVTYRGSTIPIERTNAQWSMAMISAAGAVRDLVKDNAPRVAQRE